MKLSSYIRYGVITALLIAAPACGGGEEAPAEEPEVVEDEAVDQVSQELVAQGQELFVGSGICYTCHGQDATGTQLAPDLTDDEWINITPPVTPEKIAQLVRTGVAEPKQHPAPMPPMGGAQLNEEQLQAVSAYVYSLTH